MAQKNAKPNLTTMGTIYRRTGHPLDSSTIQSLLKGFSAFEGSRWISAKPQTVRSGRTGTHSSVWIYALTGMEDFERFSGKPRCGRSLRL